MTLDSESRKYNHSTIQFYEDGYLYCHVNVLPVNFQSLESTNNNKIPYIVVFTREIMSNILDDKKKNGKVQLTNKEVKVGSSNDRKEQR